MDASCSIIDTWRLALQRATFPAGSGEQISGGSVKKRIKVAMTGAAGQIGYALLFRVSSGQMFGPETELELQLLELEQALGTLRGIVMELEDCAFPLLKSVRYGSNVAEA